MSKQHQQSFSLLIEQSHGYEAHKLRKFNIPGGFHYVGCRRRLKILVIMADHF